MARRFLLEFEKPLVELENQIDQIRELARDSEVDVSQQLDARGIGILARLAGALTPHHQTGASLRLTTGLYILRISIPHTDHPSHLITLIDP